jgi:NADH-quinone oxidoreductase subunit L
MVTTMTKRLRTIITMVLAPGQKPHETPWVVTLPLVLLAIPSVPSVYIAIGPMVFGDYFKGVIFIDHHAHPAMEHLAEHFHGAVAMGVHALTSLPFILALPVCALPGSST